MSCASGTDALVLVLMAKGIGPRRRGDLPGLHVLRDGRGGGAARRDAGLRRCRCGHVQSRSRQRSKRAIAKARRLGLKPKAIIPVDLFGLPADHDAIAAIAEREGLFVLDDAAQAFGATYKGRKLGTIGLASATSFFPAKPLGCYGDGGAVFTDDDDLAALLKSLRVHGHDADKYDNVRIGLTGRLDTIQAAVLIEKLKIFPDEIVARNAAAQRYNAGLGNVAVVPRVPDGYTSVWAQYTIRLKPGERDKLVRRPQGAGHPDRGLLPQAAASPGGLSALPDRRRRAAGLRPARGRGDQPADARLSGRADPDPHHRCGADRAGRLRRRHRATQPRSFLACRRRAAPID